MSKMSEVHQEVTKRVRNSYCMIKDCFDTVTDNWGGSGTELHLNPDQTAELDDDLWYVLEVFRHDILPWLDLKTDEKGNLIDDD